MQRSKNSNLFWKTICSCMKNSGSCFDDNFWSSLIPAATKILSLGKIVIYGVRNNCVVEKSSLFFFYVSIEQFFHENKYGEKVNDYDKTVGKVIFAGSVFVALRWYQKLSLIF